MFTELLLFVERRASLGVAEQIINDARLEDEGAFTAVGNYSHVEGIKLLDSASRYLDTPAGDLMRQFGYELFERLMELHPQFDFHGGDLFSFLYGVQGHIHAEIEKLYYDSSPPRIVASGDAQQIIVTYESHRPFAMMAMGLIEGCCAHLGQKYVVKMQGDTPHGQTRATFVLVRDEEV